jgi:RNA polymerase sigma factor (sigma-70 family)
LNRIPLPMLSDWIVQRFLPDLPALIRSGVLAPVTALYADGDDADQEARAALVKAARKFDPSRGTAPITPLVHTLRGALQAGIRRGGGKDTIRIPANAAGDHIPKAQSYEVAGNRPLDLAEVAGSYETDFCGAMSAAEKLGKALGRLTHREATMLHMRYAEGKSLAEIGAAFGISKERTRQLIDKARDKAAGPKPPRATDRKRMYGVWYVSLARAGRRLGLKRKAMQSLARELPAVRDAAGWWWVEEYAVRKLAERQSKDRSKNLVA